MSMAKPDVRLLNKFTLASQDFWLDGVYIQCMYIYVKGNFKPNPLQQFKKHVFSKSTHLNCLQHNTINAPLIRTQAEDSVSSSGTWRGSSLVSACYFDPLSVSLPLGPAASCSDLLPGYRQARVVFVVQLVPLLLRLGEHQVVSGPWAVVPSHLQEVPGWQ